MPVVVYGDDNCVKYYRLCLETNVAGFDHLPNFVPSQLHSLSYYMSSQFRVDHELML